MEATGSPAVVGDTADGTALVREVKDCMASSLEGWRKNRERALDALKMIAGENHWPEEIKRAREVQRRPCLTVNKLPKFLANITGQYRLQNMAIQVSPSDDKADVQLARIYEGMIRAIQYESVAQVAYRTALQCSAGGGFGFFRVAREWESNDGWDQVLKIKPVVNPFSVYVDPRSYLFDLSDASYFLVVDDMPEESFKAAYPDMPLTDVETGLGDRAPQWHNPQDKTVRVAEYWRRTKTQKKLYLVGIPGDDYSLRTLDDEAQVQDMAQYGFQVLRERVADCEKIEMALVSGGGVLKPFSDWPGRHFPLIPVYGEDIVYDGERHLWGVVSNSLDSQRIYNFQWTSAVESVALQPRAPYLLTHRQMRDAQNDNKQFWDNINSGIPYALYNSDPQAPGAPQRQSPPTIPTGMLELCDRASYDLMETSGVYQANLGEKSNESSGIAIARRQAQGDVATQAWPDNLRLALEHCGRVLVDLIPKIYDTQRVVRILGEDLSNAEVATVDFSHPDVARAKYDVIVKTGPSFASRREESQNFTLEVLKMLPPDAAPAVVPIVLKYSEDPAADEIGQALANLMQPAQIPPEAMMEMQGGPQGPQPLPVPPMPGEPPRGVM